MDDEEASGMVQQSASNNYEADATQGLDEISLVDDDNGDTIEEETEGIGNYGLAGCNFDDETAINGVEDIWKVNFKDLSTKDLMKYHFSDLGVAFMFYNWYASMHGFAARKIKFMRNIKGEIIQQTFFCYREGHREDKFGNTMSQKRQPKPLTRCGCDAKCRVHIEGNSGRWYIKYLNDVHNHTLLDDKYMGMLPAHRKMSDYDILQMNSMRKAGIRTSHIFGLLANQDGGYENVGFRIRDMYNEAERQRRPKISDATAALRFLDGMRSSDEMMFWRHTVDEEGRLEHLFWCDGVGQMDYSIFGDVLAFDATYGKNKYLCPLVVFSGVNHHNQSIVFASAIVGNETEETYVWLLEQLLEAMGGKSPTSVITDGDLAMRNAIKRVFPDAHHRLCAWHLLRNATTKVGNAKFVSAFRQCMLGDYDVREFKRKWQKMVAEFGLQDNNWVRDMYEKRKMWATAHIRGNFFAGFRTTSRCEGLHSQFGKYVNFQNNLLEFLQHFFRGLSYMRYKEVEADFLSIHGEPVMQTQLQALERSAASLYTREVFILFRPMLQRACTVRVVGSKQTATCFIYTLSKYRKEGLEWHVSFSPSTLEFKCSCERLESLGIPCEHLISVMVYLDIVQLPDCVVLNRWRKTAKDSQGTLNDKRCSAWDPALVSQYVGLVERCKRMATAAIKCRKPEYMRSTIELVTSQTESLESVCRGVEVGVVEVNPLIEGTLRNPARVRSKGCGGASSSVGSRGRRAARKPQCCGLCREEGHNRKCCPVQRQIDVMAQTQVDSNALDEENEDVNEELEYANVDMNVE